MFFSVKKKPLSVVTYLSGRLLSGLRHALPNPSLFPSTQRKSSKIVCLGSAPSSFWVLSLKSPALFCLSQQFGLISLSSLFLVGWFDHFCVLQVLLVVLVLLWVLFECDTFIQMHGLLFSDYTILASNITLLTYFKIVINPKIVIIWAWFWLKAGFLT